MLGSWQGVNGREKVEKPALHYKCSSFVPERSKWPLVLRSLPLTHALYKSVYLEVIAALHYNHRDGVVQLYDLHAHVSSK